MMVNVMEEMVVGATEGPHLTIWATCLGMTRSSTYRRLAIAWKLRIKFWALLCMIDVAFKIHLHDMYPLSQHFCIDTGWNWPSETTSNQESWNWESKMQERRNWSFKSQNLTKRCILMKAGWIGDAQSKTRFDLLQVLTFSWVNRLHVFVFVCVCICVFVYLYLY